MLHALHLEGQIIRDDLAEIYGLCLRQKERSFAFSYHTLFAHEGWRQFTLPQVIKRIDKFIIILPYQ